MRITIEDQIAELPKLTKAELTGLWQRCFGRAAPQRLRRQVMIPILAYRIQEQAYGGLKLSTAKRLRAIAEGLEKNPSASFAYVPRIRPGTRLLREWHGKMHTITAADNGFEYRGKRFASLSQIARVITGTRWSGPLFFGLKSPKRGMK